MSIESISCTRCGGSKFISFCKTCGDLQAHDKAIRREALLDAKAAIELDKSTFAGVGRDTKGHARALMLIDEILGAEPAEEIKACNGCALRNKDNRPCADCERAAPCDPGLNDYYTPETAK